MKPLKLRISAFGPFRDEVMLDFDTLHGECLFLITGPTGAGKTTILDAMVYALFGQTSGGLRDGSDMRSDYADASTPTAVAFSFAVGGRRYKIERSPKQLLKKRRGTGLREQPAQACLSLWQDGAWQEMTTRSQEIKEKIQEIIGFRADQFLQVVLLPQGDFRRLLTASTSEREDLLHSLFRTEIYTRLQKALKEEYDVLYAAAKERVQEQTFLLNTLPADTVEQAEQLLTAQRQKVAAVEADSEQAKHVWETRRLAYETAQRRAEVEALIKAGEAEQRRLQTMAPAFDAKRAALAALPVYDDWKKAVQAEQSTVALLRTIDERQAEAAEEQRELAEREQILTAEDAYLTEHKAHYEEQRQIVAAAAATQTELASLTKRRRQRAERQQRLEEQRLHHQDAAARVLTLEQAVREKRQRAERAEQIRMQWADFESEAAALRQADSEWRAWCEAMETAASQRAELCKAREVHHNEQVNVAYYERIWQEKKEALHRYQAAVLAESLGDGTACPVCGSTHHPRPATADGTITVQDEAKAYEDYRRQGDAAAQAAGAVMSLQRAVAEAEAKVGEKLRSVEQCIAVLTAVTESVAEADAVIRTALQPWMTLPEKMKTYIRNGTGEAEAWAVADELTAMMTQLSTSVRHADAVAKQAVIDAEATEAAYTTARQSAAAEQREIEWQKKMLADEEAEDGARRRELAVDDEAEWLRRMDCLRAECAAYETRYEQWRSDELTVKTRYSALTAAQKEITERRIQTEQRRAELASDIEQCERRLAAFDNWQRQLAEVDSQRNEMAHEIRTFDSQRHKIEGTLEENRRIRAELPQTEIHVSADEVATAQQIWAEKERETATVTAEARRLQEAVERLRALRAADAKQADRLEFVYGLASMADGGSEGLKGVTFERYVLGAILEEVISAANLRLRKLSRGRYTLERAAVDGSGRGHRGLDLAVMDSYTGAARPANTLSGGETFLASLALAMGLADCIQSYAGGIHMDTMFIDEGFGTLDADTLEVAMEALAGLKQSGRLVGIISHVSELKSRIPQQLSVTRTARGSTARFTVYGNAIEK